MKTPIVALLLLALTGCAVLCTVGFFIFCIAKQV